MKKREFRLGQGIGIITSQTNYPETQLYYDDSPVQIIGRCVGLGLNIETEDKDSPEQIRIYMSKAQARNIIRGLKMAMRGIR